MAARLRAEIQQRRPFGSLEQEVYLNLLRTADALVGRAETTIKPAGLTHTQYNVLRILRGAGREGLSCREVSDRMLTRDPDITRLLDRLEVRGLVARSRERKDRRVITARIAPKGLGLLARLDGPVAAMHRRLLGHLDRRRLRLLVALLEQARGTPR